jgi:hypothetical protein
VLLLLLGEVRLARHDALREYGSSLWIISRPAAGWTFPPTTIVTFRAKNAETLHTPTGVLPTGQFISQALLHFS